MTQSISVYKVGKTEFEDKLTGEYSEENPGLRETLKIIKISKKKFTGSFQPHTTITARNADDASKAELNFDNASCLYTSDKNNHIFTI